MNSTGPSTGIIFSLQIYKEKLQLNIGITMNDFVTVFIVPKDINMSHPVLMIASLVAIGICVTDVILRRKGRKGLIPWPTWTMPPIFGIVVGSILLFFSTALFRNGIVQRNELVSAYERGEYEIAEGVVHVFHMQPAGGHDKGDIVRVGNTEFVIDHFRFTPGYDLTIARGGALKNGAYARVYHQKGTIMRIDIRKTQTDGGAGTNGFICLSGGN
ncbi:MAG: hypothetical protein ACYSWO_21130 [Planctomycetota bacterium]|jgi:hypothetical protein